MKRSPALLVRKLTCVCAIVLGVSSMTSPSFADTQTKSSVLRLANAGEPETLDPHRYNLRLEETLLNDLFMGLTTFDARGNIVPGAAKSWSTSSDGLTWTFKLRTDLKWSDGQSLTADDFVFAFQRLQNPDTAASLAYFMDMLDNAPAVNRGDLPLEALGVRADGPHTLILTLSRPYPYLLERLLYPTAYPVPRHSIERHGDAWVKAANWVSNGAYTLREWQPQAHVALLANPHFIEPVAIQEVYYHPVVNEQSAYNRFRNKELHVIGSFPVGELGHARERLADSLRLSDLLSMMYLVFNTSTPPFDKLPVRQALSMAIDQRILTDQVLRSGNKPAFSFAPALLEGYEPVQLPHTDIAYAERLATARQLLADAGYSKAAPLRLELRHVSGIDGKKVNLAIAGMWQQLGVQTVLQQADLRNHFAQLRQGNFQVAWAGWVGENNPEHYLTLLQSDIGSVNYGRFEHSDYDAQLKVAQAQTSIAARNQALQIAEAIVVNAYAVVPLYSTSVRRLVDPRLQGWFENGRDIHQVRYLSWP
ncbi:MAG: peptide ABC transporter substrate-binding protein [Pseudomonadota bacterium]